MSDDDGEIVEDADMEEHEEGDLTEAVQQCASALLARRDGWLTVMDAHASDLHKDNDHLMAFSSFGFSRYMPAHQKQQFQDILSAVTSKTPITMDQFENGSAQFNRMVVSLVQLAYAHVACSCVQGKQHLLDQVNTLVETLCERETTSVEDLADLTSWRLLAGTYAASEVPRCLDAVESQSVADAQMLELALFAIDRHTILKRLSK